MIRDNLRNKLFAYFKKKLGAYSYRKGWLKADCPSCGEHKFGINLGLNRTNCFRCEYRPKPIDVVVELERLGTRGEAYTLLKALEGIKYLEPVVEKAGNKEVRPVQLPESFTLLTMGSDRVSKIARNYIRKRGFDPEELSLQGVGYCSTGPLADHIIIPFYKNNSLVYFIGRRFRFSGPRYHNPPTEDFNIGKSMLIYNIDSLFIYEECYVLEGAFNCLIMGENSVSMQGKSFSSYQLNTLKIAPCQNYIFILDREALMNSIKYCIELVKVGKKVKVVILPDDRDPNDLGYDETKKLVDSFNYQSYNQLLSLKYKYATNPEFAH